MQPKWMNFKDSCQPCILLLSYDGGAQKINRGGHKYAEADVVCNESYTSTSSIMPNLCVMPAASQIYN